MEELWRASPRASRPYLIVEKILGGDETLPGDWGCDGTTGYDALRVVGGLFVDPAGEPELSSAYAEFIGVPTDWFEVARTAKRDVVQRLFQPEVARLARLE